MENKTENSSKRLKFGEQPGQLTLLWFYALWRRQRESPPIKDTPVNNKLRAISRYLKAFGGRNQECKENRIDIRRIE